MKNLDTKMQSRFMLTAMGDSHPCVAFLPF